MSDKYSDATLQVLAHLASQGEPASPAPMGVDTESGVSRTVPAPPPPTGDPAADMPADVPRDHRVFANRNLALDQVDLVGFDMDYTLAIYNQPRMEALSIEATLTKLIDTRGYPKQVADLVYDPALGLRGLVVDMQEGNVFKPDRFGAPGPVRHGKRLLPRAERNALYNQGAVQLSSKRFAWIDTLFALPDVVMYITLVDFFDHHEGDRPSYETLWTDIRECIDMAHRDGSIKKIIAARLEDFVEPDPALAETLHRFRSSGRKVFLLTNSEWTYTDPVMTFLLGGVLPSYDNWRSYFDAVIVEARKPLFFTGDQPFQEIDTATGAPTGDMPNGPFDRTKVYAGGNVRDFEARFGMSGTQILYVGDHIYGDILRSRKSTAWRTAMILQELESEVRIHDQVAGHFALLETQARELRHIDGELHEKRTLLHRLQKVDSVKADIPAETLKEAVGNLKTKTDALAQRLRECQLAYAAAEDALDKAFNPYWGPCFREGSRTSKFGEQVEKYACVYTSRVSNFRYYSPFRYFRGPRNRMPHEPDPTPSPLG